jgi:hypothetical protein
MSHKYPHNGFTLPSVTTIISDCNNKSGPLTWWAARMTCEWIKENVGQQEMGIYSVTDKHLEEARKNFKSVSKKALDIGSQTHSAIENWLKTGKEPKDPQENVLNAFLAFLEFFDEHKMKPIELEFSVYGDCWAGTTDYYGWFNDAKYIIDFKTSKAHYSDEHGPQIAAYRSCLDDVKGSGILRLDKETGYPDFKDYSKRYERDLKEFNLMLQLYMHRHPRISKAAGWEV